jgi:hypothetical protein
MSIRALHSERYIPSASSGPTPSCPPVPTSAVESPASVPSVGTSYFATATGGLYEVSYQGADKLWNYQTEGANFFYTAPTLIPAAFLTVTGGRDGFNHPNTVSRVTCTIYVDGAVKVTQATSGTAPVATGKLSKLPLYRPRPESSLSSLVMIGSTAAERLG